MKLSYILGTLLFVAVAIIVYLVVSAATPIPNATTGSGTTGSVFVPDVNPNSPPTGS